MRGTRVTEREPASRSDPERSNRHGRDPRVATRGGEAGEAPSFDAPYPRTYGPPDRDRLKLGYRAYVEGHDRGWEAERKRRMAEAGVEAEAEERRVRRAPRGAPTESGPGPSPGGLASGARDRPKADAGAARYGVPVPERLDFHRGPDTWRDRIGRPRPEPDPSPPPGTGDAGGREH